MSNPSFAALFPGQGSQKSGMGKAVYDFSQAARTVFADVRDATGVDVADLCFNTDEDTLRQTQNAQLALYTVGVATFLAFVTSMSEPKYASAMAGHSVGEYAALACAGVLSIPDGATLVRRRGDLMARSGNLRPGSMAAVIGLDDSSIERICAECSGEGNCVVLANYNSPGQAVISGDLAAVATASEKLKEAGAKRVMQLNVSGAFHSPLMQEAQSAMAIALQKTEFKTGQNHPQLICNVTAAPVLSNSEWPSLLEAQLGSPVRWTQSMQAIRQLGITHFLEFGTGEVLCGLLKRIDAEAVGIPVNSPEGIEAAKGVIGA